MKTILSPKYLLMIAAISLFVASCKKETINAPVGTNDNSAIEAPSAVIMNEVSPDSLANLLVLTITHQNIVLSNMSNENSGTEAEITFSIYSDSTGVIPSGTYTYSAENVPGPFTFSQGMLKSATIGGSNSELDMPITGGTVYVTQKSLGYDISFVCDLPTGEKLNGVYVGPAQYENFAPSKK